MVSANHVHAFCVRREVPTDEARHVGEGKYWIDADMRVGSVLHDSWQTSTVLEEQSTGVERGKHCCAQL